MIWRKRQNAGTTTGSPDDVISGSPQNSRAIACFVRESKLGWRFFMKITNLNKSERNRMTMEGAKDVWKQIPLAKADGTPSFSLRVFTIEPGGHTPFHQHDFEHINYVIEGTGAVVTEGGREQRIDEGDFVLVLPNELHQYRNKADRGNLVVICGVPKEYE
jgi:quercetin dioxygenase-like cupin family protein